MTLLEMAILPRPGDSFGAFTENLIMYPTFILFYFRRRLGGWMAITLFQFGGLEPITETIK